MSVFADYIDLQTAVIEQVGDPDIADVMPRFVQMAEVVFNRRLRAWEQMTDTAVVSASGSASLPTDCLEVIGLFTASGAEYVAQPVQAYEKLTNKDGFFAITGTGIQSSGSSYGNILASDGEYTLRYYAKIPTITGAMTDTNWLLEKHPSLYLYGVSAEAAKHLRDVEGAQAMMSLRDIELDAVARLDSGERYARARVRVAGPTP